MPLTDFDTLIIGAGVAGLTAGRILARDGRRVAILEARDRLGGRVWTSRADGEVVDYGASWIHGIDGNPVADAVTAFGMRTLEFTVGSYQPDGRPIAYYSPTGSRLSDDDARRFSSDIHSFSDQLATIIATSDPKTSFGEAVERTLAQLKWDADRSMRVREFLRHRANNWVCGSTTSTPTVWTTMRSTGTMGCSPTATTNSPHTWPKASMCAWNTSSPACGGRRRGHRRDQQGRFTADRL